MKKVKIYIEKGTDEFSACMDDSSLSYSCIGTGKTVAEAVEDFKDAYEEMRTYYASIGKKFEEIEMEFRYDVPSFLQEFAYAFSLSSLERITGINQKQLGHYISGYRKPSRKTILKIEAGIQRFGEHLASVRFA